MKNFLQLSRNPNRPIQVTYAAYLLYAFMLIVITNFLIRSIILVDYFSETSLTLWGTVFMTLFQAGLMVLSLYVISRIAAGENWARWILVVVLIFNCVMLLTGLRDFLHGSTIATLINVGYVLVPAIAIALLFQGPSNRYFTGVKTDEDLPHKPNFDDTSDTNPVSQSVSKTARKAKTWLISSQVISAMLFIPWFLVLLVIQGAEARWELFLGCSALLHPITAVICGIVAWLLYAKERYRLAAIITGLPLLPFIILFLVIAFNELTQYV